MLAAGGGRSFAGDPIAGEPIQGLRAETLPLGLPADLEAAAVILAAEDRRELSEGLLRLTRSPHAPTRARAALAVGRIGLPEGYPRLLELLRDDDAAVRALAVFGAGLLELDLEPAVAAAHRARIGERIVPLLDDPEPLVAALALGALGAQTDTAAVPAVLAVLGDSSRPPEVLVAAIDAWWRLPGASPQPLEIHAHATDVDVRRAAINALRRLGDPNAFPLLADALDDPDAAIRAAAVRGLQGAPAETAARYLVTLLADEDDRVVYAALDRTAALWRSGGALDDAVFTAVLAASARRDRHVQRLALAALAVAPGKFSVPEDRLAVALHSDDGTARTAAVAALGDGGGTARGALDDVLQRYGLDVPPREGSAAELPELVREAPLEAVAVVRVLGAVRDDEADAWLHVFAAHAPTAARAEALRQLARRDPAAASTTAAAWLGDDGDPVLRAIAGEVARDLHAAGTLAQQPAGGGRWSEMLWTAQRELGEAGALEPRLVLLDALRSLDAELLQVRAGALLPDDDRVVRLWALRNLDPPQRRPAELAAAARAPLDTGRTPADYRRLAQRILDLQQDPPLLAVETPRGTLTWRLQATWAPLAALAYLDWVDAGFYDGLVFHRVVAGFVAQAGDPSAVGIGGAPGSLRSEETPIAYTAGTVGLALAGRDTGGSQFFITDTAQPHLDGRYPVLGRVVDNARFVQRIQPGDRLRMQRR